LLTRAARRRRSRDPGPVRTEERVRLLRALPGFDDLPGDVLAELAPRLAERHLPPGGIVVREGDRGDCCFLVVSGRAEISIEREGGLRPLAGLGPGDHFGELALVLDSGERQATVTALSELHLLALDADSFREVISRYEPTKDALARHAERILKGRFIEQVAAFASLDAKQREALAAQVSSRQVEPGELIIREGEPGSSCYMLHCGTVEVFVTREGREERVDQLRPGALFGEASLLTGAPRNASVRALEAVRVDELAGEALLQASRRHEHVSRELVQLVRLREFPRRASGIELHASVSAAGDEWTVLKNPRLGTYYRLSERGRFLWERLDGEQNLRRLTLEYLQAFGQFAPQFIADLIGGLARGGFLDVSSVNPDAAPAEPGLSRWSRSLRRARRLMEWEVGIPGIERVLTALYRGGVRLLFTRAGLVAMLALSLAGLVAFVVVGQQAAHTLSHAHGRLLLFSYLGLVVSVAIHEAGHAFATLAFGRRVQRSGVGWYWFGPIAFVDTSDMWLGTRAQRIAVSLAGPAADLVTAGALSLCALFVAGDSVVAALWSLTLPLYLGVLLNLNPLMEFDGYHVLSDLLERPNLRAEALGWLRTASSRLVRAPLRTARGHWLELGYSLASLLYVAVMAALTVLLYRLVLRRLVELVLPSGLASAIAWAAAGLVVVLAASTAIADLRKLEEARDRLT